MNGASSLAAIAKRLAKGMRMPDEFPAFCGGEVFVDQSNELYIQP